LKVQQLPDNRGNPVKLLPHHAQRDTLAQYARVLGKIRRAVTPPQKHWWHVSLRVTAVGLTTTPLWSNGRMWKMVLNLATHQT
jgi:hypothetical protein